MKTFKKIILLIAIFISTIAFSQGTGQTIARQKGITTSQMNSLTVPSGEFWKIYNTDDSEWKFWNGTAWEGLVSASGLPNEFINGDGTLNNFIIVTQEVDLDLMETDTNTNNGKVTNVTTNLSEGSTTNTTVDINSSDGTNATLVAASASRAGVMTKAKFDEVVVNNGKNTNVTTDISFSRTSTTLTVISSDGNDAILPEADTTNAGILGSDKWDEIVANTVKTSNATHTGDVTGATALTIASGVVDTDNLVTALKATAASTTTTVNFDLGILFPVPMVGNSTLTFSNFTVGKVITLFVTGNFTLTLPTEVKGDLSSFDGTLTNVIDIRCINSTGNGVFTAQIVSY